MKTNLKRSLIQSCLVAVALLALPAVVQAQFTYTTIYGTITITGYTGSGGAVTIPSTINGLPVTSIGVAAFASCTSLTSVTIGNAVTSIGDEAFDYCESLTTVTIGNSVTSIGYDAFADTALTSVTIPNSVTSIGDGPFGDCTNLTEITVAAMNPFYSSVNGVLFDKNQTTLIQYPGGLDGSYTIPNSVTSIGGGAFAGSSLTSVTIPDNVTSIGDGAFASCTSLTNVTIPNSVTNIGDYAFTGTALTTVTIPDRVTSIGDGEFGDCTSLTSVTIGNAVTSIGGEAFLACTSLTSVTIPNSVTSIGDSAFARSGLTNVTVPDSVISVEYGTFAKCFSLTTVMIGNSVTYIGDTAFYDCGALASVFIASDAPSVDWGGEQFDYFDGWDVVPEGATVYYLPGTLGWTDYFAGEATAPWLPQIQPGGGFSVHSDQFGFKINWASGQTVVVEACTNLSNPVWIPVGTNILVGGTSYFSDPQPANLPGRFYRLRSQ